jgi:signal transduction histidine kinase
LNLLSNAIKFTASGGSVGIEIAHGQNGALHICVVDTGIGMSPEDLAEIVLPFRQVENAFSTSHDGTGLGVPIALELARLHDGTIQYESAPGKGTTATLVLPAERVEWQGSEPVAARG